MKKSLFAFLLFFSTSAFAQVSSIPRLPTSSGLGLQGSAGVGFGDFNVNSPKEDFKIEQGTFAAAGIERGFNVFHLYLTLGLSHMMGDGTANYSYSNLSSSTNYSVSDVKFKTAITDLSLGIKLKLIDDYWFRPYIEGGGLGGYHQINYTSKTNEMAAQGSDYKTKDTVMGSGYYGEFGIETMFSEKFGIKLAARESRYQTKAVDTLGQRSLKFTLQTYYFSLLFGF